MLSQKHVMISCILVILYLGEISSRVAPDFIKPCPGLTPECLKKNIQETLPLFTKGIPSLGIETVDPGMRDRVELELPGGLKILMTNGVSTGFRKCIIDSVKFENAMAEFNAHCNITIKGKYKAAGKLLIVTINGDGDAKIKIPNIAINAQIKFADKIRDGIVYHEVQDLKVKTEYKSRVSFVFTNLFKGNPELSQTVLTFLNENWKQVVQEFAKPIEEVFIRIAKDAITKFFSSIPKSELITP